MLWVCLDASEIDLLVFIKDVTADKISGIQAKVEKAISPV